MSNGVRKKIPALIVHQWLHGWDSVRFRGSEYRRRPGPSFYVLSIPAVTLKRLTGITRRQRPDARPPSEETAVQRKHIPERSVEILRFLKYGFPLSKLGAKKADRDRDVLQMPGWLPTSILVNIDETAAKSGEKPLKDRLVIEQSETNTLAYFHLPTLIDDPRWVPERYPLQIIDGQHRLWALDDEMERKFGETRPPDIEAFEVPVVAFYGLAPTWQAYLFYTINQLPKRIDTSLVFDLYPLLRTQEWLLRFEGPNIYRETRAQDIVTALWSHPESPWKGRILRFGGRKKGAVTQAAFIRALLASFIKSYEPAGRAGIGGLFGSRRGHHEPFLNWDRDKQAAFLIISWNKLLEAVRTTKASWAKHVSEDENDKTDLLIEELGLDFGAIDSAEIKPRQDVIKVKAFSGGGTLIATDQGIRGYCSIVNDLVWLANEWQLINVSDWRNTEEIESGDRAITRFIRRFERDVPTADEFLRDLARAAAQFDWRSSSVIPDDDPAHRVQASYRGSGGYKLLRRELLKTVGKHGSQAIKKLIRANSEKLRLAGGEDFQT